MIKLDAGNVLLKPSHRRQLMTALRRCMRIGERLGNFVLSITMRRCGRALELRASGLWADHNVRTHGTGTKRFNHPVVGELTMAYEELAITAEPGLVLLVYTAEPGSPSAERLRLLASWAATADAEQSPHDSSAGPPRSSTRSTVHDTEGT
jgi:hypothetical protein